MINAEVLRHNEFEDVVPTFLCFIEHIDAELMLPPNFVHCF